MTSSDTFGWDTVFAIGFATLNSAIRPADPPPAKFTGSFTDIDGVKHGIEATLGVWQLCGGSGDLVHLRLPLLDGQITVAEDKPPVAFAGSAIIEVKFSYRPRPQLPKMLDLMVASEQQMQVIAAEIEESSLKTPVKDALDEWLQTNPNYFSTVFATVSLDDTSTHPEFQWLQPTSAGYAVYSDGKDDPTNAVLGILAMTEQREGTRAPEIDPGIIPSDSTSGLLIAQQRFVDKILLPNLYLLFRGAKPADFKLADDGLTIVNNTEVTLQNPVLEDGTVVTDATIDAGKFAIDVFGDSIRMTIADLNFTWKSGFKIHIDYVGTGQLSMNDGHEMLLGNNEAAEVSFMITKTDEERWREVIQDVAIGVGASIPGAVIGGLAGPLGTVIYKGVMTGVLQGVKAATGSQVSFSFKGLPDSQIPDLEKYRAQNSRDAAQDIRKLDDPAYQANLLGWFPRCWRKILGGTLASVGGQDAGHVADILDAIADAKAGSIPTPDAMALDAVAAYGWTNLSKAKLISLDVTDAVRLGLKLETQD